MVHLRISTLSFRVLRHYTHVVRSGGTAGTPCGRLSVSVWEIARRDTSWRRTTLECAQSRAASVRSSRLCQMSVYNCCASAWPREADGCLSFMSQPMTLRRCDSSVSGGSQLTYRCPRCQLMRGAPRVSHDLRTIDPRRH